MERQNVITEATPIVELLLKESNIHAMFAVPSVEERDMPITGGRLLVVQLMNW
jgi:hypothetical protein